MIAMDGACVRERCTWRMEGREHHLATKLRMLGLVRHVQTGLASVAENLCRCAETVRTSKDIGETRLA